MASETQHGYLVLADISGYTSYLAQVELEHANEILTDLLAVIVDQFKQALTISKLEGDAVFANINESGMPNGERLLELIESTYSIFAAATHPRDKPPALAAPASPSHHWIRNSLSITVITSSRIYQGFANWSSPMST